MQLSSDSAITPAFTRRISIHPSMMFIITENNSEALLLG